jgi:hypothetical protein
MLADVADQLTQHTDREMLDLEINDYYKELIQVFSDPTFGQVLSIPTLMPRTRYYAFRGSLDKSKALHLKMVAQPQQDSDFWLIVRSHDHHIETLREYLNEEFQAYDSLQVQGREVTFIGIAGLPSGNITIVVFLSAGIETIEGQKTVIESQPVRLKVAQFDRMLSIVMQGHEEGHFGFDLRPGTILLPDNPEKVFTISLIGRKEVLEKLPDRAELSWDASAAPELDPPRRRRGRGTAPVLAPTVESDIYSLASLLKFFFGDSVGPMIQRVRALDDLPRRRCTLDQFQQEYDKFRNTILEQPSPALLLPNS